MTFDIKHVLKVFKRVGGEGIKTVPQIFKGSNTLLPF